MPIARRPVREWATVAANPTGLTLLLLRHAKSSRDAPGADDHERDLDPRGVESAPRMGRLMRERGLVPDLVLCSTARRAARTWELAAARLGAAPKVRHARQLYLASPDRLLEVARGQGPEVRRLLIVGHNPGLELLARSLAGAGEPAALAALRAKFPTAALARLLFDASDWRAIDAGSGRLVDFWRPSDLGS